MAQTTAVTWLTWPQVLAWRLTRQHLDRRVTGGEALGVVRQICGLHAQVMSSTELTLWARVEDLEPGMAGEALWEQRSLVKTWAMRGTLHVLPAGELPLWVAGLSAYAHFRKGSWLRHFGFTDARLDELLDVVPRVLDGSSLTREQLAAAVE